MESKNTNFKFINEIILKYNRRKIKKNTMSFIVVPDRKIVAI